MAKNLKQPRISVIMSVYNGGSQLREAIDSMLAQDFEDFEFIIIDDGSTDSTAQTLSSYQDPRLHVITQTNKGLVASLNRGVGQAKASFIARQDADDTSEPSRLSTQLSLLNDNPEICIVGSSMSVMGDDGDITHEHRVLLNDAELKQELLVRSPFAHGSVLFRKASFIQAGGYRQDEWPAEDYGLWLRMAGQGKFANVDKPLYVYREHAQGISSRHHQEQLAQTKRIRQAAWLQRGSLLGKSIITADYPALPMGQLRLERITHNLLFTAKQGATRFSAGAVAESLKLLLSNKDLRRKCARLVLVKLRIKHA